VRICLSIGAKNIEEALRTWKRWASRVDVTEIRLDTLLKPELHALFNQKPGPVLVTNRSREEGGFFEGYERSRVKLLIRASAYGADFIDIEARTEEKLLENLKESIRGKETQLILSWHNFTGTPSQRKLREHFHRMASMSCDIVKIVTWARKYEDNLATLSLIPYALRRGQKIIAFCMGPLGKPSRVLGGFLGSYLTYVSPGNNRETASGQLKITDMLKVWRLLA